MTGFGDQPQAEMGERKGLAGPGAGLEQAQAWIQGIGVGLKPLHHAGKRHQKSDGVPSPLLLTD